MRGWCGVLKGLSGPSSKLWSRSGQGGEADLVPNGLNVRALNGYYGRIAFI